MARTSGNTPTERFLNRLARRSFLSLWSYPAPFRDQGTKKRGGEGAELCDLLVVFDNHVLIFSDKDCDFQAIPNVELAWRRWYTKTIQRSADQIWGAERWLRQFPGRVFLDRACTQLLPIPIPEPENAVFHRIVVAHDSTGRRRQIIGGSGSLLVDPELLGNAHLLSLAEGGRPFSVGQVDPDRGYIHVFDEATLGRVMRTLDTITDFVNYLTRKEEFIVSGRLLGAFGEEDLLAYYLSNLNEFETHDFVLPNNADKLWLQEGHWETYIQKPEVSLKAKIDRVSYIWDELIETVAGYAVEGKLLFQTDRDITRHEQFLRTLAREPRIRRRMLARDLMGKVTSPLEPGYCSFVMVEPSSSGDPHYVFVVAAPPDRVRVGTDRWERHRDFRREVLRMYCMAAMHHYKDQAEAIVGIATEHGSAHGRTFDLVGLNRRDWDEEMNAEALQILGRTGWFQNRRFRRGIENEYPQVKNRVEGDAPQSPSVGRNQPCPCGSGKKYKKCHGVLQQ